MNLIIFIPGYTLLGSVYKNYQAALSDIPSILFDYYNFKTLDLAREGLEQVIIENKEKKTAIIAQSTGFKIIDPSLANHENVLLILGLNPFYQLPKKTPFGVRTHKLMVNALANASHTNWGKFILFRSLSVNQLLLSRKFLANPVDALASD